MAQGRRNGPTATVHHLCIQVRAGLRSYRDRDVPKATQRHLSQAPLLRVVPTAVTVHLLLTLAGPSPQQRVVLPTTTASVAAAATAAAKPLRPTRVRCATAHSTTRTTGRTSARGVVAGP